MAKKKRGLSPQAKGWRTRRARAKAKSAAARQGWRTRRARANRKKRTRKQIGKLIEELGGATEIEIAVDYQPN